MGDNPTLEATVRVLDDGKVTIPEPIRAKFGIEKDSVVKIEVSPPL